MSPIGSPTAPVTAAAYFVELAAAPALVAKEWSLYPKAPPPPPKGLHQSFSVEPAAESMATGGGASVNNTSASGHLSQRASGRSIRKKSSKSNFDTMSHRKSVLSSGGGDNQRASFAIEQESRPTLRSWSTPRSKKPHRSRRKNPCTKFSMEYERLVAPNAFGEEWLLAMDNFINRVLSFGVPQHGSSNG